MLLVQSCKLDVVGKFTVQQQVGDFEIGALFGQLINGITAIFENALVAVDERDATLAGGGIHERRIVGHQTKVVVRDF